MFVQTLISNAIITGKDILARARTGSGKTAAYALPILQNILLKKESGHSQPVCSCLFLFSLDK